jgi:hypothetical protein
MTYEAPHPLPQERCLKSLRKESQKTEFDTNREAKCLEKQTAFGIGITIGCTATKSWHADPSAEFSERKS